MNEPEDPDPTGPRYSQGPFPPYRFVPGRSPHPTGHPDGHSYGKHPATPPAVAPERWRESDAWLRGVDLYNHAYWWECHEELEGLWNALGRKPPQAQFVQGIIQVAAANLKKFLGARVHLELAREGLRRHEGLPVRYMGMDVPGFARDVQAYHEGRSDRPAIIRLSDG